MNAARENSRIEFKETLIYDVYQAQANTEIREEPVKEFAAFAMRAGYGNRC